MSLSGHAARLAPKNPVTLIPARMAASRLPGKPLADIHGKPMIVHVWERAMAAKLGPVYVACPDQEIVTVIKQAGGEAVLTKPDHPTGSDRINEALRIIDPEKKYDAVINVQGDIPTIDPDLIRLAAKLLQNPCVDIGTLAVEIQDEADKQAGQIVKAVFELNPGAPSGRAFYFTRVPCPAGDGPLYHHIGLYAYRREALEAFVNAPRGRLEARESLEQLRALALGLHIEVAVAKTVPLGVDTPIDLEKARLLLKP